MHLAVDRGEAPVQRHSAGGGAPFSCELDEQSSRLLVDCVRALDGAAKMCPGQKLFAHWLKPPLVCHPPGQSESVGVPSLGLDSM